MLVGTRAGSFTPDANGFLRNTSGHYLMGWPTDSLGNVTVANPNVLSSLQTIAVGGIAGSAVPTTAISMGANLPAADVIGASHSLSVDIFDSLGVQHTLALNFTKTGAGAWGIAPTTPAGGAQVTLTNAASQVYAAAGHLEFSAVPADGDTITIAGTTFEFDTDAAVGGGNTAVDISAVAGSTAAVVTALKGAIDGVPLAENARFTASGNALVMTQSATGAAIAVDASSTSAILQTSVGAYSIPAIQTTAAAITFDGNGLPASFNVANVAATWANGANASAATLNFGTVGLADGVTGYASEFTTYFINQDGVRFGVFNGVSIDEAGMVTALFDNGQTTPIYKIPIATFNNVNGLESITGNVFRESDTSGNVLLNAAGTGPAGRVAPSALEASNVDIATEFTAMIITQQAYSAAARIITTADEMLDEILRIAR